ncbi:hypothetical protein PFISCL1PPCAC_21079, partial [Pristionchus fissidentatus]
QVTHKECYDTENWSITVSFKIKIISSSGTNPRRIIDFYAGPDNLNDVKLIVEGKTIAVSKNLLSLHSSFFSSLFYGDFEEKTKGEIELPEVKYEDVVETLKMIYPSRCKVNSTTVEGVLSLADRWDMSVLTRKCDKFLSKDVVAPASTDPQKVPLAKKVLYASKYALPQLQHALLTAFDKKRMIEVMESIVYKEVGRVRRVLYYSSPQYLKVQASETKTPEEAPPPYSAAANGRKKVSAAVSFCIRGKSSKNSRDLLVLRQSSI